MTAGPFCGRYHLLTGGFRPAKPDVVFHRVVKKVHILKDHADVFQHTVCGIVSHIFPANSDYPLLHIPKAGDQITECGLATARGPTIAQVVCSGIFSEISWITLRSP